MARTTRRAVDRLTVEDLSPLLVRRFLEHLETERGCGGATRNLRLGAIHSLAKFIGCHSPEHLAWCTEVRAVPFKKTTKPTMAYLDKPEIDALLAAPDRRTERGARDHAILLFLYNTGARVDEATHVTVGDLTWSSSSCVRLMGKGNKARYCPLWAQTVAVLKPLVRGPRFLPDAQKTHAPAHVEAGQAFDPALFKELAPTADRVVIQQQSVGDFSAAPPRVQQNQSVGPARHARRRRPIARQRDQLFAILFAKEAASNHKPIGIRQTKKCKEFLPILQ